MGKFSCVSVFLPSDTRNGNRDTEFILKDQEKELGIGNLGALFILLKKNIEVLRGAWIGRVVMPSSP